jgi:hypothetical protein
VQSFPTPSAGIAQDDFFQRQRVIRGVATASVNSIPESASMPRVDDPFHFHGGWSA